MLSRMTLLAGSALTAASVACAARIGNRAALDRQDFRLGHMRLVGVDDAARHRDIEDAVAGSVAPARRSDRDGASSGDCGSATSSAASACESRFGSLPK